MNVKTHQASLTPTAAAAAAAVSITVTTAAAAAAPSLPVAEHEEATGRKL